MDAYEFRTTPNDDARKSGTVAARMPSAQFVQLRSGTYSELPTPASLRAPSFDSHARTDQRQFDSVVDGTIGWTDSVFGGSMASPHDEGQVPLPPPVPTSEGPCPCPNPEPGLTDEQIEELERVAEKAKAKEDDPSAEPLSQEDFDAIFEAICCAELRGLGFASWFFALPSIPFKKLFTAFGVDLGFAGGWTKFPKVSVEILAHVDRVFWDTAGWTAVDVTVWNVNIKQEGGTKASRNVEGQGTMRVELHPSFDEDELEEPLEYCQFRWFRGELRYDSDGSGFMEVHVEDNEDVESHDGDDEVPPVGPSEPEAPPGAGPSDYPPPPGSPPPPPRAGPVVPPPRPGPPLPPPR